MKRLNLAIISAFVFAGSFAQAKDCGILRTAQGQTAANLIDAQIKQGNGKATVYDEQAGKVYTVKDARVSSVQGFKLSSGRYFDFKVTLENGNDLDIDIEKTFLFINADRIAVNLNHLTGCNKKDANLAVLDTRILPDEN